MSINYIMVEFEPARYIKKFGVAQIVKRYLKRKEKGKVNLEEHFDWLDDMLVFDQTSLKEVIEEVSRKYDKIIELENADIGSESLIGKFADQPIEDVISSICLTLNLQYRTENEKYTIYR